MDAAAGVLQRPTMRRNADSTGGKRARQTDDRTPQQQTATPTSHSPSSSSSRASLSPSILTFNGARSLSLSLSHNHSVSLCCWLSPSLCRVSRLQTWFDITRWQMRNNSASAEEIYEESSKLISSREIRAGLLQWR